MPRLIASQQLAPKFYDVDAAATLLGVSPRYIRRLVSERRIPFFKPGGYLIRFSEDDLLAFAESSRVEAER